MFSVFSAPSTDSLAYKADKRGGLARLYTEPVPASDHRFYSTLLCHFTSPTHAFDTFSIRDARDIRDRQPENFKTLVELLVAHLDSLKRDELFAKETAGRSAGQDLLAFGQWVAAPLSPFAGAFGGGSQKPGSSSQPRDRTREALNCARLLARLIPVLMEAAPQSDRQVDKEELTTPLEERVLWSRASSSSASAQHTDSGTTQAEEGSQSEDEQFVIEDEDDPSASPSEATKPIQKLDEAVAATASLVVSGPALAERIIALCIDYLFFPGFSLPQLPEDDDTGSPDDSRVHFAIWEKGVGSSVDLPGTSKEHIAHRVEFLRLLLVMLSKSVYVPPAAQQGFEDRALQFTCTSLSRTVTLPLLCSLLNTACSPDQGAAWSLPGFAAQPETEGREAMRALALQILTVLLGWSPAGLPTPIASAARPSLDRSQSTVSVESTSATSGNQFAHWLSKIHRVADLGMISSSLFALLRPAATSLISLPLAPSASSSQNSSSQRGVYSRSPEVLSLPWHILRSNPKFKSHVLDDPVRAPLLLSILLSQALLGKDSVPLHGLVRLSLFILQDVSAHTGFAKHISAPNSASKCNLPAKFASLANGASSAADILIAASYSLLTNRGLGSNGLGVHPVILITLANCAPFFVALTIPSSTRLSLLLAQVSNAAFLLADEGHPRSLYFLLEAINSILLYQADSNRNMVYALLSKSKEVKRLESFTLRKGIAEIRRKAGLARIGGASSAPTTPAGEATPGLSESAAQPSGASKSAEEEKALLAARDTATSPAAQEAEEEGAPAVPSAKALGKARRISAAEPLSSAQTEGDEAPVEAQESGGAGKEQPEGRKDDGADEWVNRLDDGELFEAASRVGKNGFVPSEEWVKSWVDGLPLTPLNKLFEGLLPEMEILCSTGPGAENVESVIAWLREQDLSSLFPKMDPSTAFTPRPFQWTTQVDIWWWSFIWGSIYVAHSSLGLFTPEGMKLFHLILPPQAQGQAQARKEDGRPASTDPMKMLTGAFDWVGGALGIGEMTTTTTTASRGQGDSGRPKEGTDGTAAAAVAAGQREAEGGIV
ncbi:hypothetical protein BCV69DRAFT_282937 [Microstroma glucosiphilum]|uniref:High-temperature-induced dauer-formation protein n=1 Tax=Pseudomicrostroma glucosiphilum TaxID=1684307 RepID=A0A316U647_9BASI|nr:hypothetical protein BCV69DRAFT_282937 [Pseudomicrostroma glucosiphilum]PWN20716.1 hypothetical protein BCV69DRAFT_282937 [Pseudomicrostroma glucosiphilum]